DGDEIRAELVTLADIDEPGVVFGVVPGRQQFLKHDGNLLPVRRRQRIELQRVLAARQLVLVRGTGNRAVGAGKGTAVFPVPRPHLGRHIFFGHRQRPFWEQDGSDDGPLISPFTDARKAPGRRHCQSARAPLLLAPCSLPRSTFFWWPRPASKRRWPKRRAPPALPMHGRSRAASRWPAAGPRS